jgi:hypothetical protein
MSKLRSFLIAAAAVSLLAGASLLIPARSSADNGPNHRVRNLNFGVSGGNVRDISRRFCCSGTLGSLIQDNLGTQYILSNNHVVGLADRATAGDDISQPGLIDSNCQIATVVADFTVAPALSTNVDAAIAQLRPGQMNPLGTIEDIGVISSTVAPPAVGMLVQKSGRTTGHTSNGSISSINTTVSIKYPTDCGGNRGPTFTFTGQVVVTPGTFSAGGDSGSLIVTRGSCPQPVALLFAGSSSATIGNPIGQVLSRVGTSLGRPVSFVGTTCTAAAAGFSISEEGDIMQELAPATADAVSRVIAKHEGDLMSRPGVLGVGVGQGSTDKSEGVVVVYVDRTQAARGGVVLPKTIDGVRVRRVLTDEFVAR